MPLLAFKGKESKHGMTKEDVRAAAAACNRSSPVIDAGSDATSLVPRHSTLPGLTANTPTLPGSDWLGRNGKGGGGQGLLYL